METPLEGAGRLGQIDLDTPEASRKFHERGKGHIKQFLFGVYESPDAD
jgi:hypothetical protein